VEFDVQLSKDLVPVLYHDFHVCIAMKRKKQLAEHDMLELPVKDLTLEQLQHLKVLHHLILFCLMLLRIFRSNLNTYLCFKECSILNVLGLPKSFCEAILIPHIRKI
jgi:glycerophosphoryl diester phosphodiesterase